MVVAGLPEVVSKLANPTHGSGWMVQILSTP